jgi:D-lactate dehydrogenase
MQECYVCVFLNDVVDAEVIKKLAENGVEIIALRCAGFNNVDVVAKSRYKSMSCSDLFSRGCR